MGQKLLFPLTGKISMPLPMKVVQMATMVLLTGGAKTNRA